MYRRVLDEKWDGRSSFSVEEAGEIVGLSRASAYKNAATCSMTLSDSFTDANVPSGFVMIERSCSTDLSSVAT